MSLIKCLSSLSFIGHGTASSHGSARQRLSLPTCNPGASSLLLLHEMLCFIVKLHSHFEEGLHFVFSVLLDGWQANLPTATGAGVTLREILGPPKARTDLHRWTAAPCPDSHTKINNGKKKNPQSYHYAIIKCYQKNWKLYSFIFTFMLLLILNSGLSRWLDRWQCLPPNLSTCVQFPGSTWWQERTNSYELGLNSDLYPCVSAHTLR